MGKIINFATRGPEAREWRRRKDALARQPGINATYRMVNAIRELLLNSTQVADIYGITVEYLRKQGYRISAAILAEDIRMRGALIRHPKTHDSYGECGGGGGECDGSGNCGGGGCGGNCGHHAEAEVALAIAEYKSAIAGQLVAVDEAFEVVQYLRACYPADLFPPFRKEG